MTYQWTTSILSFLLLFNWSCDRSDPEPTQLMLEEISDLPGVLDEASGLIIGPNGNLVGVNDKGNYLYEFDYSGNLIRAVEVVTASNEDWEDLSTDTDGNILINDTGNNSNDRMDLVVYKIEKQAFEAGTNSVTATEMQFSYLDQTEFPPGPDERNFDSEAMIYLNGRVCLFSKDRNNPFRGITNYYQIIGEEAILQTSYSTDDRGGNFGAITGAAINGNGTQLVLISNRSCWLFSEYSGLDFFSGRLSKFDFDRDLQIEGVAFEDDCTLILVDEKNGATSGKLFRANICL